MKRAIGALVTVLIGAAIFVAIGIGFHAQKYQSVAPTTKAVDTGTTQMVNGKSLKVYTLNLYSYPDSTGTFDASTGAPAGTKPVAIHKNGNPPGRSDRSRSMGRRSQRRASILPRSATPSRCERSRASTPTSSSTWLLQGTRATPPTHQRPR